MLAVTGASGRLGRLIIEGLLKQRPAADIVALVRTPYKVRDLAARGVHVRRTDYAIPETLEWSLSGIDRLLLVSSSQIGKLHQHHRNVICAAKRARVRLLAYTSILHADTSRMSIAAEHAATEAEIRSSGLRFVFLRNGCYLENRTENLAAPLERGVFHGAAGTGRIAAAARADYADAAVAVLTRGGHDNPIYELAGDGSFSLDELAGKVSARAGRLLRYCNLPAKEYRELLLLSGMPAPLAQATIDLDLGIARGELESSSRDLHELIGREPQTLDQALAGTAVCARAGAIAATRIP